MRFALEEDREALRSSARHLLTDLCPPEAVRSAWTEPPDARVWHALDEAGALAVLVPEAEGGLGLDETYLVPVVEEAGRVALPHPLTVTALVAAPLGVVGSTVATDLGDTAGDRADARLRTGAYGSVVAAATHADAFLLEAGTGELRLYDAREVTVEPVATVDASRHCGRVRPRSAGRTVAGDAGSVAAAFDRGVLGTAAELLGLSRTMLDLTVSYTAQRHQFGRPVGSFQAIKHHLADARLQIEFAAPAVMHAAYTMAQGSDSASRSVSQAKFLAGQAAAVTGRAALQCHGAIGYTTEHDLHLYLKRSWALARSWGDSAFHCERVAAAIGL